jgi:DNA-binding NarL/FixJ family response regulator
LSGLALSLGQVTLLMLIGKVFEDKSNLRAFRVTVSISIVTAGIIGAIVERIMADISIEITLTISLFTTGAFLLIGLMFYSITQKEKNDIKVGRRIVDANEEKPDWEQVLTPKEKEVFALLLEGLTMRQIAGELHMKYDAVNYHYKNIYRKLNINSRVELIVRYVKN